MANWSLPSLASTYTNFVTEVANRDVDCARGFSTAYTLATNLTTGTIRWHDTNKNWEKYNGATWDLLASVFAINTTGYATHLAGGNSTTLLGSLGYQTDANVTTLLSPNTTTTKKFLTLTGTGTNGAAPGWNIINDGDLPAALTGKTYNGNTFTAGTGILTLAASKTFTCSNTLTFTGTDGSALNIGAGGTLGTAAYTSSGTYALLAGSASQAFAVASLTSSGAVSGTTGSFSGAVTSSSATAGVGYATGAGGSVTQITSITTAVTLNRICGEITCVAYTFFAGSLSVFTLNNSSIGSNDIVVVCPSGLGYQYIAYTSYVITGSCQICLYGTTASASIIPKIRFAIIKNVLA